MISGPCRVILVVAFGFLPQNFGRRWRPTNSTLPFHECRLRSGDTQRWCDHSNLIWCNQFHLNKSHLVKLSQHLIVHSVQETALSWCILLYVWGWLLKCTKQNGRLQIFFIGFKTYRAKWTTVHFAYGDGGKT